MTQEERNELGKIIVTTAVYYGKDIDRAVLSMQVDDLADLPFASVRHAYTLYRRDPKNRSFPLPAQIRDLIQPTETSQAKAREIAAKIQSAVSKFGQFQGGDAKEFIGPVGWEVVRSFGGWGFICHNLGKSALPVGSFYAQTRDLIEDILRKDTANEVLQIGGGNNEKIKALVQGMSLKEVE